MGQLKKNVKAPSGPIGLGNIFEVFSRLEDIGQLLSEFLPQMERLIGLMEKIAQPTTLKPSEEGNNLQEQLTELLSIARETRETSGFVKMVFTQERPKLTKKKVDKSDAVNEYLRKYNKSMRL